VVATAITVNNASGDSLALQIPVQADTYVSAVRSLAERYYESVTRYTTSSFMRLKLSGHLSGRGLAPHIYESRQEALDWLDH